MTTAMRIPDWTLGWRLRRALDEANVGMDEIAHELGVSRNTIGNWCHDRNRPSTLHLKQFALRCGVPYEWLKTGLAVSPGYPKSNRRHRPLVTAA